MAAISENFDVRIRVVFPFLTKSLPKDDSERINATGTFNFDPPPQVDVAQGQAIGASPVKETSPKDRAKNLKDELVDLLAGFNRIQEAVRRRSQHITFKYDPELAENEALANAEADLFGTASGAITYDMFDKVMEYNEKIDKYISHLSIENEGVLNAGLAS